jgi:hypothetical protein
MSLAERQPVVPPRESLATRFLKLKRGPWEALATIVIAAGVLMLMQPFSIALYSWSFITVLVGTAMFVIVSHFKD